MNPSSSFKQNDRVEATNTLFKMHGTVERVGAFTGLVRVRWDERTGLFATTILAHTEWVHPSHLRLLPRKNPQPAPSFSKGDVVEIIKPHPSPDYVGALGVVVEVHKDADMNGTQFLVRPYGPSKPFVSLSRGPFHYYASELKARKALGLVPVNFVREALGLAPADPPKPKWTPVGYTEDAAGFLFATGGTLPPKVADIVDVKGTPRGLEATFQISDEAAAWLNALAQPKSIRISPAMRRRGIVDEAAIRHLESRADTAEIQQRAVHQRADSLTAKLEEANRRLDQLARQLAGRRLAYQELSEAASTVGAHQLRRELGEHRTATAHARAELEDALRDLKLMERRAYDAERERANAHNARHAAENRAEALVVEQQQLSGRLRDYATAVTKLRAERDAARTAATKAEIVRDQLQRQLDRGTDVTDLVQRAETAERDAEQLRRLRRSLQATLTAVRGERERAEALTRDLADERDNLRDQLANAKRAAQFNDDSYVATTAKLRAERDSLKAEVRQLRTSPVFADLDNARNELHRAHVSRQQAENERDELKAAVRSLRSDLGSAINRSRLRGEAINRIQNAVRGL